MDPRACRILDKYFIPNISNIIIKQLKTTLLKIRRMECFQEDGNEDCFEFQYDNTNFSQIKLLDQKDEIKKFITKLKK